MVELRIQHKTTYRFREPVMLAPHRLMLRPRENRELRLLSHVLKVTPEPVIAWSNDVFGNAIAMARFAIPTDTLFIESVADILLDAPDWPVFDIAASAINYPFRYSDEDWIDLGALTNSQYPDLQAGLLNWAKSFVRSDPTDTLSLLKDLNSGVAQRIQYQSREVEGTQSPDATLNLGWGSCRDFAVLFAEAARKLGFGVRIVSGYLHDPSHDRVGSADAGSTHAWAEVFVPGAGWITFDPTNRSVGNHNLIPVAVGREIGQCTPVSGSFFGKGDTVSALEVEVSVDS